MTIEDQIKAIEDEIQKTPYNKNTQHHIGKLKAKMARLKEELQLRQLKSGGGGARDGGEKKGGPSAGPRRRPSPRGTTPPRQRTGPRRGGGGGPVARGTLGARRPQRR